MGMSMETSLTSVTTSDWTGSDIDKTKDEIGGHGSYDRPGLVPETCTYAQLITLGTVKCPGSLGTHFSITEFFYHRIYSVNKGETRC